MYKKILYYLSIFAVINLVAPVVASAANAITTANVNMRIAPSIDNRVLVILPNNSNVYVRYCQEAWCQVSYKHFTGWVSSDYISYTNWQEKRNLASPVRKIESILVWSSWPDTNHRHYKTISFYEEWS